MDVWLAAAERQRTHGDLVNLSAGQPSAGAPGPVVAAVLEGPRAVSAFRQLAGGTDPVEKATPGTIRGDFGLETQFNLVHGSDSAESAAREIALWFPAI
jgi:nucleoside diphosphate kinase